MGENAHAAQRVFECALGLLVQLLEQQRRDERDLWERAASPSFERHRAEVDIRSGCFFFASPSTSDSARLEEVALELEARLQTETK